MELNKEILQRFIKDTGLPIKITEEPFFSYFIDLYDNLLNSKAKLELLKKSINKYGSNSDFLKNYYDKRNNILNKIQSNEKYIEFNTGNIDKYNTDKSLFNAKNIFTPNNVGKYLLSIDLSSANFQALKFVNKSIVYGADTYKEFISKFTDDEYFQDSKNVREVLFGKLNPKRQIKVEKYLTNKILQFLFSLRENETELFPKESIISLYNDEIIIDMGLLPIITINKINNLAVNIKTNLDLDVHVETFVLRNIGKSDYYVKEFMFNSKNNVPYEFKCVPDTYFAQVYKLWNGLEIFDLDLYFCYDGKIAKFVNPLFL